MVRRPFPVPAEPFPAEPFPAEPFPEYLGAEYLGAEGEEPVRLDPPASTAGSPQRLAVINRHVLWESWGERAGRAIVVGSIEGGTAVYVSASEVGVRHLSTDGAVVAVGIHASRARALEKWDDDVWCLEVVCQVDNAGPRLGLVGRAAEL